METLSANTELDWTQDPEVLEARKRLTDVTAIREERDRERALLWDHQFSDDPFLRAKFRSQWHQADQASAQAEQYHIQARTRLTTAEQAAKARSQPVWDHKFRDAWATIEQVLHGPLTDAMVRWESLVAEASATNMIVPVQLPNMLSLDSMAMWRAIVRKELHLG